MKELIETKLFFWGGRRVEFWSDIRKKEGVANAQTKYFQIIGEKTMK